jgi:hypothetical protein
VWGSPGCTWYGIQLKDHIMKSEKKIICIWLFRKLARIRGKDFIPRYK